MYHVQYYRSMHVRCGGQNFETHGRLQAAVDIDRTDGKMVLHISQNQNVTCHELYAEPGFRKTSPGCFHTRRVGALTSSPNTSLALVE
jgi:hypothetical protein